MTTLEEMLDRVTTLAPTVDRHRGAFDAERRLPGPVHAELVEREFYRLWTPQDLGGLELAPADAVRVIAALGRLEGAVGWNAMIPAAYSLLAGHMDREAAEEIYRPPEAAVAGALRPGGGVARVAPDGFVVTGRWTFGSAGWEATWFLAQCFVEGEGAPPPSLPGVPPIRLMFAPATACQIHDTWRTSGLRGTGSNDYSLEEVHVPPTHSVDLLDTQPVRAAPLYRCPTMLLLISLVAAVPLGIARAAVDAATDIVLEKRAFPAGTPYAERETVQVGVARAENLIGGAEALLLSRLTAIWEASLREAAPTARERALLRGAAAHVGESCCAAVETLCEIVGSDAIHEANRLERCRRDVHAARAHMAVAPAGLIEAGTVLLGGSSPLF